jgi:hypothetical protein
MKLTSVDLVGRGANQEAHISLFKGLDADPTTEPHTEDPTASRTISKSDPDRFDRIEEFP